MRWNISATSGFDGAYFLNEYTNSSGAQGLHTTRHTDFPLTAFVTICPTSALALGLRYALTMLRIFSSYLSAVAPYVKVVSSWRTVWTATLDGWVARMVRSSSMPDICPPSLTPMYSIPPSAFMKAASVSAMTCICFAQGVCVSGEMKIDRLNSVFWSS